MIGQTFTVPFEGTDYVITVSPEARAAIEADARARMPYPPKFLLVCFGCCEACSNAHECRCCADRVKSQTMSGRRAIVGQHRGAVRFEDFIAWAKTGAMPARISA
jgi:hypothetical protein